MNLYTPGIGYQVFGNLVSVTLGLTPFAYRYSAQHLRTGTVKSKGCFTSCRLVQYRDLDQLPSLSANELLSVALGGGPDSDILVITMVTLSFLVRICLTWLFFFLLSVAERTYKQVRETGARSGVGTRAREPVHVCFRDCCSPNSLAT